MKKIIPFLILFTLCLIGFILLLPNLGKDPLANYDALQYPSIANKTADLSYLIVDNSRRRITKINEDNEIIFQLNGGRREEGQFFYAEDIVSATDGSFFILNYVLDEYGMFLLREEIIQYSGAGEYLSTVHQYIYGEKSPFLVQRGQIFALRDSGDFISWLSVTEEGVEGFKRSIDRGTIETLGFWPFEEASSFIADVDWESEDTFLAVMKTGEVWLASFGTQESNKYELNEEIIPWELTRSDRGDWYLVDLHSRSVLNISIDSGELNYRTVLSREILSESEKPSDPFFYYRLSKTENGFLTTNDFAVIEVEADKGVSKYLEGGNFNFPEIFGRWILYLILVLLIASFIINIVLIYRKFLGTKVSLIIKQLLVLIPLLAISMVFITSVITQNFLERFTKESIDRVSAMTQIIASSIDPEPIKAVTGIDDFMNEEYRALRTDLERSLANNQDPWNEGYYFAVYRVIDDTLYGFMYLNNRIGALHPFSWYDDPQSEYRAAMHGEVTTVLSIDNAGSFLYGVAPITDSDGNTQALLEIGTDLYLFNVAIDRIYADTMRLLGGIIGLIIIIVVLMTILILRSIRVLSKGVERIAGGEWDYQVMVRSNDEVSELSKRFNDMSQSITSYMEEIETTNKSYKRFFPEQFLAYLDLPSINDARLGDQVQKDMSILFSDIRSFTNISEGMTPEENFNFLNNYLSNVGPYIRNHNGFVDKYIGDAIMALFPKSPMDAIDSSIEILKSLSRYNNENAKLGSPDIRIGIGIHSGRLMMGILGEEERMQGTVISDAVNLASRLESLTKEFNASILVSKTSWDAIPNHSEYLHRYLGKIRVKGKRQAMAIFEILDGEPAEQRENKIAAKNTFELAIDHFEKGAFQDAHELLTVLQRKYPDDRAVLVYLKHTQRNLAAKINKKNWDGAISSDTK